MAVDPHLHLPVRGRRMGHMCQVCCQLTLGHVFFSPAHGMRILPVEQPGRGAQSGIAPSPTAPEGEGATYRVRAIITDHYGNVTWTEIVYAIVQPIYRVKASPGIRQEKSTKRRIRKR